MIGSGDRPAQGNDIRIANRRIHPRIVMIANGGFNRTAFPIHASLLPRDRSAWYPGSPLHTRFVACWSLPLIVRLLRFRGKANSDHKFPRSCRRPATNAPSGFEMGASWTSSSARVATAMACRLNFRMDHESGVCILFHMQSNRHAEGGIAKLMTPSSDTACRTELTRSLRSYSEEFTSPEHYRPERILLNQVGDLRKWSIFPRQGRQQQGEGGRQRGKSLEIDADCPRAGVVRRRTLHITLIGEPPAGSWELYMDCTQDSIPLSSTLMVENPDTSAGTPSSERSAPRPIWNPRCPDCSSRDTRLSHKTGVLISLAGMIGFSRFKCRVCGKRFFSIT